jgi:hypothetical protein
MTKNVEGGRVSGDGIFLTSGNDLVVLNQQPYATEDVLQQALADHPEVIAGPTTAGTEAGKLLLVRREMGVPGTQGGGSVWSLDHLFLDADGVPVVVEVKRSSDARIRREVVGQMLDYAANGVKYWPIASLRAAVDEAAAAAGKTGEEVVTALRDGIDPEEFWKKVEANLTAGQIRMLFVADALPAELVRIIEFLNEQMNPAEVLGVELRQYVGGGQTVYVPSVVGRTSMAVATKASAVGQQWTEATFLDAARTRRSDDEVTMMERLIDDVHARGVRLGWGKGVTPGVSGWYTVAGQPTAVWNLNVNADAPSSRAYMYYYLGDLAKRLSTDTVEQAAKVLESVPAMAPKIAEARINEWNKYPSVYLTDVAGSSRDVDALFQAIDALIDTVSHSS